MSFQEHDPFGPNLLPAKPYLLFLGEIYYPGQSVENLAGSADTVEELADEIEKRFDPDANQWWEIVRHVDMCLVKSSYD